MGRLSTSRLRLSAFLFLHRKLDVSWQKRRLSCERLESRQNTILAVIPCGTGRRVASAVCPA